MGYWVLGNICRYWVVLLLGDIFFIVTPNMIPNHQTAVSIIHMISLVQLLSADDVGEWGGVECKQYIVNILRFYVVVLYILCFDINTLLC